MSGLSSCVVCNHSAFTPFYQGLLQCERCEHVFANLHISDAELKELYSKNYFFGEEYLDYVADARTARKNFRLRLDTLRKFLDPQKHKSLLEVGCAYGFFLDEARNTFKTIRGIDISEDAIRYASQVLNLDVALTEFQDYEDNSPVSVGCMWDTIEHLKEPHLYIEKFSKLIPRDGLLCITTGDIKSKLARFRKNNWRLIHPPTHIHYFSKKTIASLLEQHGFYVVHNEYCGFYRSLDMTLYNILVLRKKRKEIYDFFKKMNFNLDFYLNTFDIMYVIGKKR